MEMEIATFPTIGGARASTKAAANETTLQLQWMKRWAYSRSTAQIKYGSCSKFPTNNTLHLAIWIHNLNTKALHWGATGSAALTIIDISSQTPFWSIKWFWTWWKLKGHGSWLTSFEMGACGLNWQNNSINVGTFSLTQLYSFGSRSQFNRTSSLQFRCCIFFLSWRSVGRFNSSWKQMHRTCVSKSRPRSRPSLLWFLHILAHTCFKIVGVISFHIDSHWLYLHKGTAAYAAPLLRCDPPGKTKLFSLLQASFHHPVHWRRNHPWIDPKQASCGLQVCRALSGEIWRIFPETCVGKQYIGTLLNRAREKK